MRRLARLLRPLGVPALIALVLTAWPLFQILWLVALAVGCVWLVIRRPRPKNTGMGRQPVAGWSAGFGGLSQASDPCDPALRRGKR